MKCFFKIGRYQFHWHGIFDWRCVWWEPASNTHQDKRMDIGPLSITRIKKTCRCDGSGVNPCPAV